MKKGIVFAMAIALMAPAASFAATYDYVDATGFVRSVEADSAAEAFAKAVNIAPHSGVALRSGTVAPVVPVSGGSVLGASTGHYHYVDVNGVVQTVEASSAAEAFAKAVNIAPHSGVTVDHGLLEEGDTVPGV